MTDEQRNLLKQTTVDEEFLTMHSATVIGNNIEKVWVTTRHRITEEVKTILWQRDINNNSKYAFYYVEQTNKKAEV